MKNNFELYTEAIQLLLKTKERLETSIQILKNNRRKELFPYNNDDTIKFKLKRQVTLPSYRYNLGTLKSGVEHRGTVKYSRLTPSGRFVKATIRVNGRLYTIGTTNLIVIE